LKKQGQGGGIERIGVDADLLKTRLDIAGQLLRGPGLESEAKAEAAKRGALMPSASGQELFVATSSKLKAAGCRDGRNSTGALPPARWR